MTKFRKKPVEVEAMQWTEESILEIIQWLVKNNAEYAWESIRLYIRTLEGTVIAHPNDWLIRGVEGEFYPCKDSIFKKTYEEVEL